MLLLDEPFASLDAITRADLQEWLVASLRAERADDPARHPRRRGGAVRRRPRPPALAAARAGSSGRSPRRSSRALSRREAISSTGLRRLPRAGARGARGGRADELGSRSAGVLPPLHRRDRRARGMGDRRRDRRARRPARPRLLPRPRAERDRDRRSGRTARCSPTTPGSRSARSSPASPSRSCSASSWPRSSTSPPFCAAPSTRSIVASQTIPIIVVAPIFVVWFGFGIGPKIAIIALICFFPIVVNTLDGLVDHRPRPAQADALARRRQAADLHALEAPTALPYLLSGAKIAVAVAVIGAVFGEWAGSDERPRAPDAARQRPARGARACSPPSSCSRRWRSRCSACSRWSSGGSPGGATRSLERNSKETTSDERP